ncbi:hypothetical protein [Micrococcus sp.]|uniref:hypothetical protein n=1 Tax=Micrococcus sp. TaxID=1271 RepID=UPI002A90F06E|nr:hypothetical protein [Micrococcus sp.]MDY6056166.1 hypothetical protein [Micrococcus sp.]
MTFRVERREGQTSNTSGIFYPANQTSNLAGSIGQTNSRYNLSAAQRTASAPGWDPYVVFNNSVGGFTFTNPRGGTHAAANTWTMTRTWRASSGAGTYQSTALGPCGAASIGCRNFGTGEAGNFTIQYTNLARYLSSQAFIYSTMYITVTLSDGTVIQHKTNDEANAPQGTGPTSYMGACTLPG